MMLLKWLKELDEVLRGRKADPHLLASGTAHIQILPLVIVSILLGIIYGIFMGLYAVTTRTPPSFAQLVASSLKVPALFFLTLVVTFPSLYVFSALLGVRLGLKDTLRVILVPMTVNLTVLASLGTITGFFTLSTTSYPFMKLLNVVIFGVSGIIGLKVLLTMLSHLEEAQAAQEPLQPSPSPPSGGSSPNTSGIVRPASALPKQEKAVARTTFRVWVVIYGLVGAQMGWILRPFIGAPDLPFTWFRGREANVFVDIVRTIGDLLKL